MAGYSSDCLVLKVRSVKIRFLLIGMELFTAERFEMQSTSITDPLIIFTRNMELQSRNVFIDTHYFLSKGLNFESKDLLALTELATKGLLKVLMSDITEMEITKKIGDEIALSYAKINHSETRYLKSLPLFRHFLKTYSEANANEYIENKFDDFKRDAKVQIISSDDIKLLEVFSLYVSADAPFKSDKSKNRKGEFPDAFALITIENWCDENDSKTYVVSGDSDWEEYCRRDSWTKMIHLPGLSELLDATIRNEVALKDLASFSDNILESHKTEVLTEVLRMINQVDFRITRDGEEIEILENGIYEVIIEEKDIIQVDQDKAKYNLMINGKGIFKCKIPNYDESIYDPEDRRYAYLQMETMNLKAEIYAAYELEISFIGGVPANFKISDLDGPDTIELFREDLDYIDFQKWLEQRPVVVCGVANGVITEDGMGAEHFLSFNEAKAKYPALDIDKSSMDFTPALGKRMVEKLRFETWKAQRIYSAG